jgi:Flp pilus assembly secretin CpaC
MKTLAWIVPFVLLAVPAVSEEKAEAPAKARPAGGGLRVQVVLSRYKGDQKIGSYPYMMTLANSHQSIIRMGTEVPIAVSTFDKEQGPMTSFQYRNVGINMECTAEAMDGGRYDLYIAAEASSLGDNRSMGGSTTPVEAPMFLTRNVRGHVVLRDGETAAFSSATDTTTGEVSKVDVTLNVLK